MRRGRKVPSVARQGRAAPATAPSVPPARKRRLVPDGRVRATSGAVRHAPLHRVGDDALRTSRPVPPGGHRRRRPGDASPWLSAAPRSPIRSPAACRLPPAACRLLCAGRREAPAVPRRVGDGARRRRPGVRRRPPGLGVTAHGRARARVRPSPRPAWNTRPSVPLLAPGHLRASCPRQGPTPRRPAVAPGKVRPPPPAGPAPASPHPAADSRRGSLAPCRSGPAAFGPSIMWPSPATPPRPPCKRLLEAIRARG